MIPDRLPFRLIRAGLLLALAIEAAAYLAIGWCAQ